MLVCNLLLSSTVFAEQQQSAERAAEDTGTEIDDTARTTAADAEGVGEKPDPAAGILPIPDYASTITDRLYLTGDWGGSRTKWANKGFQFDVDSVLWTDTAVAGGSTSGTEFGGNVTYNAEWDLMRAGILPGALVQVRAESRFGSSGNQNTGQVVPMNTAALSPTNYSDFDKGYDLALSQLTYLQMLSEKFGIILGKFDLYADGDANEFAGGRGRTQFMNWSLNYGTPNLFVPASTLGAGLVYLPSENLTISSLLLSGAPCSNGGCFDDLSDKGGVSVSQATYQYEAGGLPGGVTGMFAYFFDKDFEELDGILPVPGPPGWQGSPDKNHSWIVGGSFWQYISTKEAHEGPLDLTNRQQDLAGWGIFSRLTFADDKTNPWKTSAALGLGARGVIPGRPNDMFGVGYFYNGLSDQGFVEKVDDGQGVEGYYNLEILPSVRFSVNLQWLKTIRSSSVDFDDDTVMLSTRLQVVF